METGGDRWRNTAPEWPSQAKSKRTLGGLCCLTFVLDPLHHHGHRVVVEGLSSLLQRDVQGVVDLLELWENTGRRFTGLHRPRRCHGGAAGSGSPLRDTSQMRLQPLMKSGSLLCSRTTHWYARFLKTSSSSKRFFDSCRARRKTRNEFMTHEFQNQVSSNRQSL